MKTLINLIIVFLTLITITSCASDEPNLSTENAISDIEYLSAKQTVSGPIEFLESVAIIQRGGYVNPSNPTTHIFIIELKNFSDKIVFNKSYVIDGIEYNDDGQFNDDIANDGIYTSIYSYKITEKDGTIDVLHSTMINISETFQYQEELDSYLQNPYGKIKIKFGCKVRTIPCPETSWYNSCWPMSSPCTCIEFYDCEVSMEIEL